MIIWPLHSAKLELVQEVMTTMSRIMCGVITVAEGLRKNLVVYMSLREVGWKEIMLVISSWLDIWVLRRYASSKN